MTGTAKKPEIFKRLVFRFYSKSSGIRINAWSNKNRLLLLRYANYRCNKA